MKPVIFTDLDGTLLDLETYSYDKAVPSVEYLRKKEIPIVFCSSKTRAEQEVYRKELKINDPFIIENGGAILIPKGYFPFDFDYHKAEDGYQIIELGVSYHEIRRALERIRIDTKINFKGFGDMSVEEVASVTGLNLEAARRAKASEYDEGARPYLDLSWMDKTATTDTTATDTTATDTTATKTAESPKIVSSMRLYPNYPNPFNPETTIRYGVVREGPVILDILNTRGQRIRRLIDRSCTPGEHHIVWDGRDDNGIRAASGSYLYRIEQKENRLTGRLQLVK